MRRSVWLLVPVALALVGSLPFPSPGDHAGPFVVHEWGTFNHMQGSGGTALEGLQHEEEVLPAFVHSRIEGTASPFRVFGDRSFTVPARRVRTKMETPILYFHTDVPRRVRVEVGFEGGLMTHWFPEASDLQPSWTGPSTRPLDVGAIERSSLAWDLDLHPADAEHPPALPEVEPGDLWRIAREVRAADVETPGGEAERYVFYRGLGNLDPALEVTIEGMGMVVVSSRSTEPVPTVIAIESSPESGRFAVAGPIEPGAMVTIPVGPEPLRSLEEHVEALAHAVTGILVDQGLYADEARAMVRTWSHTWFASEGTRLLYLVPPAATEAALPLTISPAPDELVRVLVGRLEYLTPDIRAELVEALVARATGDPATVNRATERLARLGRFLEPAMRQIAAEENADAVARESALEILRLLGA